MVKNSGDYRDVFLQLVKELRLSKRLTQAQVAARLKVPQSYVSKYEMGERRLDFVETVLVCKALGISIEQFARAFSSKARRLGRQAESNL